MRWVAIGRTTFSNRMNNRLFLILETRKLRRLEPIHTINHLLIQWPTLGSSWTTSFANLLILITWKASKLWSMLLIFPSKEADGLIAQFHLPQLSIRSPGVEEQRRGMFNIRSLQYTCNLHSISKLLSLAWLKFVSIHVLASRITLTNYRKK